MLVISHDRDVLNNAVNAIIHLDQKKLNFYRGDYDQFERQRAEKLELLQKQIVKQTAERKHMESFVERFRAKASKARQAQSRLKALERMQPLQSIVEEHVTPFVFDAPDKQPASPIIAMEKVSVGYEPGRPILSRLDLRIDTDDRIALLGQNGNGKSTFAKLLADRLKADSGDITKAPGLKIAFFAQHQIDDLRPAESAVQHVRRMMPDAAEAKIRAKVAPDGPADPEDGHGRRQAVRWRKGAAFDGPCDARRAERPDPRRTDQPSRHRGSREPGASAQRLSRRRHPDQP